jgi:hypothetical protein
MLSLGRKTGRIHPFVTISIVLVLFVTVGGIFFIWNPLAHRADKAIFIQNVVDTDGITKIYVQNIGQASVTLDYIQVDGRKKSIEKEMVLINNENTNILPMGHTAIISIMEIINLNSQIKVVTKSGAFAVTG